MAELTEEERREVLGEFMRNPAKGEVFGVTKDEFKEMIIVSDQWAERIEKRFLDALHERLGDGVTDRQCERALLLVWTKRMNRGA